MGQPTGVYESTTLLSLGVSVRFNTPGFNQTSWSVTGWYCLGKFYSSTDAFRTAIFSDNFELPAANEDGAWAWPANSGTSFPDDDSPPVSTGQNPQNFAIDLEEAHVSWKDFSVFLSTSKSSGLSLYDLRFRGNRIIYEITLQEALAHYASADPVQSQTCFFDTAGEGLGNSMRPLISGFDCPSYATYINATITSERGNTIIPNAICLFEFDTGYPIRRHWNQHSDGTGFTDVTKNVAFTIRTISTVGNYDYLIEYVFGLDGAIEISARASGYISAAYAAGNEGYGFQIHDYLSGAMHDHVLPFKVDLDILGLHNSVQKVEAVPTTVEWV
jgi:primary-amine oxidase